jgi:hypothetical protein
MPRKRKAPGVPVPPGDGSETLFRGPQRLPESAVREAILSGKGPQELAQEHGVARSSAYSRLVKARAATVAVLGQPMEAQVFASSSLNVLGQLDKNNTAMNGLLDACMEWLDPLQEGRFDLSPRSDEVMVIYEVVVDVTERGREITEKRRKSLQELLTLINRGRDEDGAEFRRIVKAEHKHADPRELIIRSAAEARHTIALFAELVKQLTDVRLLEDWRKITLEEIGKESPECQARIAERLQRSIAVALSFQEAAGMPLPGEPADPLTTLAQQAEAVQARLEAQNG